MATAVLQKHQTLMDIALQECGSTDALFALAALNNLEPTQDVAPGTLLLLPAVLDEKKVKYLKDGGYKVVTGPLLINERYEGLDYWAIELDFIIT